MNIFLHDMNISESIIGFLQKHKIDYKVCTHKPIYTVEDGIGIANEAGVKPMKCLLLGNRQHKYYMLLIQGNESVNLRMVADMIGSSRLSFAGTDVLEASLHTVPGAVSPMGLIFDISQQVELVIDESVLQCDKLMMALCVNDQSVIMETRNFINDFLPASRHYDFQTIRI